MRLRITSTKDRFADIASDAAVIRLGRELHCEVTFDWAAWPMVSGEHARLERGSSGWLLVHLSRSNKTLLNDRSVDGQVPVRVGDRVRLGQSGPIVEIVALDSQAPSVSEAGKPEASGGTTRKASPERMALLRGSVGTKVLEIGRGGIIGREEGEADFLLDHPLVSRRHARIRPAQGRVYLEDLGSANGTYINGRRVSGGAPLRTGDEIDIGPFSLVFDGQALISRSRSNNIELAARGLRRLVKDRATGERLTLLDGLSLVVRPGELVCLLGPSGSGKSTLLTILSGRNPPDKGTVRVNGQPLYENFAALKQDIAVVPQTEALHESLPVGAALRYTAELRLPPDTSPKELDKSVGDILETVGLTQRRGTLIKHLSGGQRKRASLANELISQPSLLFLDEVTSGLDEQTDADMMELFRQVAGGGKTVLCITHSLANVETSCHLVLILTEGGRLAFIGTPEEAKQYFGIGRLGEVYKRLGQRPAADWQGDFKRHPLFVRYVRDRFPALIEETTTRSLYPGRARRSSHCGRPRF